MRPDDLTLVTCSFNTPRVTLTMLRSYVHHHGPGPHRLLVMENSTNDETARALESEGVPFVRNPGGRHSPSVDQALATCDSRYALLVDTDIVFRRSIEPVLAAFLRHDLTLFGTVCADRGGHLLHPRVHPWFCLIDLERVRAHGIRFHDERRINESGSGGFFERIPLAESRERAGARYDVGSTFYEDVDRAGLRIGNALLEPRFYIHYEGMSWQSSAGESAFAELGRRVEEAFRHDADRYAATDLRGRFCAGFHAGAGAGASRAPRRKRIGFLSVWFERGQAYVTRALRAAVADAHDTFVFARMGHVEESKHLALDGHWAVPNLTTHDRYEIDPATLLAWAREHALDAVVFNEEYDWKLVAAIAAAGIRVVTYLDFHRHDWKAQLRAYDLVLCSTRRTFELVQDVGNAELVGWTVDTDVFRPREGSEPVHTFFHNAGWLGINHRKMTPAVILAFDALASSLPQATLFVHAQVGSEYLPPECQRMLRDNPRVVWHKGTVPPPGLYHRGQIQVFPSKLEGLGLPLPEGLSAGLPAIATHAPPMTEFVTPGENGLLVRVGAAWTRHDGIAFPETIVDVNDLAAKMLELGSDLPRARAMGERARERALVQFEPAAFRQRVLAAFDRMWSRSATASAEREAASPPQPVGSVHDA